jgi:hypothetical protein
VLVQDEGGILPESCLIPAMPRFQLQHSQ